MYILWGVFIICIYYMYINGVGVTIKISWCVFSKENENWGEGESDGVYSRLKSSH